MKLNYSELAKDLIRALRGEISQQDLNKKIKAESNQISRWESGHSAISWADFLRVSESLEAQKSVQESIVKYLCLQSDPTHAGSLLRHLTSSYTAQELAARLNISSAGASRLKAGKIRPRLALVLQLIDLSPYSLADFVGYLPLKQIPSSLEPEFKRLQTEKNLHYKQPWVAALILYLQADPPPTQELRNRFSILAAKVGVPTELVEKTIVTLLESGSLVSEGEFIRPAIEHLSTAGDFEGNRQIRIYWLNRLLASLEHTKAGEKNLFGYKIFSATPKFSQQVEDLYFRFYTELDALIRNAKSDGERVYILAMQLSDIEHLPKT